jgi:hypothetical protein
MRLSHFGNEAELFAEARLKRIRVWVARWEKLYRDPASGAYWLMTYPQGEKHGGGPPRLDPVDDQTAERLLQRTE